MGTLENALITKIYNPKNIYFKKAQTAYMNNRDCFGLVFCMVGNLIYECQGIKYSFNPANAFILPKGASYSLLNLEDGVFLLMDFDCQNLDLHTILSIPLTDLKSYIEDFKLMSNYFLFNNKKLKRFELMYGILERLDSEKSNNPLSTVIDYIEENISDCSVTNVFLAEKLGISEVYLRKLFQSNFGITPKKYILNLRIKKAKQLLVNSNCTVTDISEKCGFSSVYHFCRIFKEKTNMTPLEYANKKRIFSI